MPNNGFVRRQIRRGKRPKHKVTKFESYVIATYIFLVGVLGITSICTGIALIVRGVSL